MNELFPVFGGWAWWILACVFLIAELLVPGVFLVWLGAAAVAIALIEIVIDMPWQLEIAVFAVLSLVLVLVARPWVLRRQSLDTDQPHLNQRMLDFIGRRFVLEKDIVNGRGRIRIDDTLWDVLGPDQPAGTWVVVTGVEGTRLTVVRAEDRLPT